MMMSYHHHHYDISVQVANQFLEENWRLFRVQAVEVQGIVTGRVVQIVARVKQL